MPQMPLSPSLVSIKLVLARPMLTPLAFSPPIDSESVYTCTRMSAGNDSRCTGDHSRFRAPSVDKDKESLDQKLHSIVFSGSTHGAVSVGGAEGATRVGSACARRVGIVVYDNVSAAYEGKDRRRQSALHSGGPPYSHFVPHSPVSKSHWLVLLPSVMGPCHRASCSSMSATEPVARFVKSMPSAWSGFTAPVFAL